MFHRRTEAAFTSQTSRAQQLRGLLSTGALSLDSLSGSHGKREDVVLLLDASFSMGLDDYPPTRLAAAVSAAVAFWGRKDLTNPRDRVAVVAFHGVPVPVVPFGETLENLGTKITLGPNTAMGAALSAATDLLRQSASTPGETVRRRIVLLSDGGHNTGPDPRAFVPTLRSLSIKVDTVAIGAPREGDRNYYDEALLRGLAVATGGTFSHAGSPAALIETYERLALPKPATHEQLVEQKKHR